MNIGRSARHPRGQEVWWGALWNMEGALWRSNMEEAHWPGGVVGGTLPGVDGLRPEEVLRHDAATAVLELQISV